MIERLGFSRSTVKPAVAWVAEKLGRLKLNGQLRGYSPLSRLVELEGLLIGINGKTSLWKNLDELDLGERAGIEFEQLIERAEGQLAAVNELRRLAAAALAQ